jgi:hypothetical protein
MMFHDQVDATLDPSKRVGSNTISGPMVNNSIRRPWSSVARKNKLPR